MILYVLNRFKIVSGWSQMFWMVIKRYQYFQMSLNTPDISKWFQMFQFQNYQEIFRWFQVSRIFRDFFQSFLGFFEITRGTGLYQNFGHERFLNFFSETWRKNDIFFFALLKINDYFIVLSCCALPDGKLLCHWKSFGFLAFGSWFWIFHWSSGFLWLQPTSIFSKAAASKTSSFLSAAVAAGSKYERFTIGTKLLFWTVVLEGIKQTNFWNGGRSMLASAWT